MRIPLKIKSFIILCFVISITSCHKDNKQLYGDWIQTGSTNYPSGFLNCRILSFHRFRKITEYSSSDNCITKENEIRQGKYKYTNEVLTIIYDDRTYVFNLIGESDNELLFIVDGDTNVKMKLTKI